MKETRKRGFAITNNGISLIEQKMKEKGLGDIDLTFEAGLDKEGKAITRIRNGHRPQRKTIQAIAKVLDINPTDLVDPQEWYRSSKNSTPSPSAVNWRSVSKGMLDDLKRLTTEALTAGDGIRFDFDDVFVPLGVVERKERTKRKEDDGAPDRGSELYEEKVTPITHDEFFEDVLLRGNTKISKGKRIAVIGEAGAGKTTQLQKIGSWLLEASDDIPVWISLTDLGAKSLREYLFENWVREASGEIESAPQAWKDSLGDAIKSGKVWLLLDGVDEMTVSNPLSYLSTQLKASWLKNVRIVLTCRVNVWDGGKNALTDFDVYRNLDFDYPDDVYKFIGKWFAGSPELAGSLTQALEQSGKERIRDMVKNPLRLTLLCYSWQLKQGELPETKAGLYEWFVEAFYKWNKGKAQIELSRSQEEKLNQALGELAKRAIDGETSRFRLTKTFIENVFREFDVDLFDLALKLNWLNEIGVAAEDPLETVYAFYHPSFQEYFAALAIDDWRFFLPSSLNELKSYDYPIFDARWYEVILLWFGREDIEIEEKETFISALINFDDGCGNFPKPINIGLYSFRAYSCAATCLQEFRKCRISDLIVRQIIEWALVIERLEYDELGEIEIIENSIGWNAKLILKQLPRDLTEKNLIKFLEIYQTNEWLRWELAKNLILISSNIQTQSMAIREIIYLMDNSECEFMRSAAIESLGYLETLGYLTNDIEELKSINIDNENKRLIVYALVDLIQDLKCESTCAEAARVLSGIITEDEKNTTILSLIYLIEKAKCEDTICQAVKSLEEISTDINSKIFTTKHLVNLIEETNNEDILTNVISSLGIIANDEDSQRIAVPSLIKILDKVEDELMMIDIIESLEQIDLDHSSKQSVIKKLQYLINTSKDDEIVIFAANKLALTSTDNDEKRFALSTVINLIETSDDENVRSLGAWSLGNIDCNNDSRSKSLQVLTSLIDKYQDNSDLSDVIESLISITTKDGNPDFLLLPILSKIIKKSNNEETLDLIANRIQVIATSNENKKIAISLLLEIINKSNEGYMIGEVIRSLKIIATDSEIIEFAELEMVDLLKKTDHEHTLKNISQCLGAISIDMEHKNLAISTLTKLILESKNEDICSDAVWELRTLLKYASPELLQSIIFSLSNRVTSELYKENIVRFKHYYNTIWYCAQNMSYPDFYKAWHLYLDLESQFIDCAAIQKELDRTTEHPKIRCLVVDISHLENLTDQNLLSKRIWNGLQKKFRNSELPKVNDIGDLEYELDKLQKELGKKLAIALYGKNANEAINQLCQSLTPIQIRLFTGEKSTQELINRINTWLSEM